MINSRWGLISSTLFLFAVSSPALLFAQETGGHSMMAMEREDLTENVMRSADCSQMEVYDVSMAMCMPLAMKGMPMTMLMLHGNGFLTEITESGARGRNAFSVPNMFMADLGTTVGDHHYLNLDLMGTVERWTTPDQGYPELLQIGEENNSGVPYLDAQHPHSSPIMGLTFSDTISFEHNQDHVKLFIAPRGEATDGPVAFMHRVTGVVNPDAPLGHHIGQDVGHISSSVVGESLKLNNTRFEFSTYNGSEPKPQNVDLPIGNLNSYSFRIIEEFNTKFMVMASYACVSNPEPDAPDISFENRYSASLYNSIAFSENWNFDNAFIWGAVSNYDHTSTLTSFADEFVFSNRMSKIWARVEELQRTPVELQISTPADGNSGQWMTAMTLGYTHNVTSWESVQIALGGSITTDFLPQDYQGAYSGNPWSGKVFLQMSGMKMWSL